MKTPVQITYRDFESSPSVNEAIHEKVAALEKFFDNIISCHVTIEYPEQNHHRKGNLFKIHVDLHVPNKTIVVGRNPSQAHEHEDIYVALRDAFNAAKRQLQDYVRQIRGE